MVTRKTDNRGGKIVAAPAEPTGEGAEVWKVKVGKTNEDLCRSDFDIGEVAGKISKRPRGNPMPVGTEATRKTGGKRGKIEAAPAEPTGESSPVKKVARQNEGSDFDIVQVTTRTNENNVPAASHVSSLATDVALIAEGEIEKHLRGIHIQRPWARMILNGLKKVEARGCAVKGYLNEDLWIIETPYKGRRTDSYIGVNGKLTNCRHNPIAKAHIIGIVRFGSQFQYHDLKHWRADEKLHRIPRKNSFDWRGPKRDKKHPEMYGWKVTSAQALVVPQQVPEKRGMRGCKAITRIAVLKGLRITKRYKTGRNYMRACMHT